jgi:hypothetical protein
MESDYNIIIKIGSWFLAKILDYFCSYRYFIGQERNFGYRILWTIGRKNV